MRYKGIVKNNTIIVNEPISLPDETKVEVEIKANHPLMNVCGICKEDEEWDDILNDIYKEREMGLNREVEF